MGIFPIIMNVLQFWLIDSIVKASGHHVSVALPDDATDDLAPENEPLFHLSDDEDGDNGSVAAHRQVHDIENPRLLERSQSRPSERELSPLNETKLSNPSSTLSSSPTELIAVPSDAIEIHAYPPSNTVTPESSVTSQEASSSMGSSRSRRSLPPPLSLLPRSPAPQAVNGTPQIPTATVHRGTRSFSEKWESWDDDADDWADRVGEEDWTGRRISDKKATVDNVWASHTPSRTGPIIRAGS